jgi:2-keto-4-pentenoate hydratase/2-oxohepta-3-ene-1,7-dioic acid hydratase in catechol pathway
MKIICIGRNYRDYISTEGKPLPEEPVFFLKPDTSLLVKNRPFYIPAFSNEVRYEVELVLKISKLGRHISEKFAHTYFNEIGIGIDFTAADALRESIKNGLPWEKAKAFDFSSPVGNFYDKNVFPDHNNIDFHLDLNGKTVQYGNSGNMVFSFTKIIAHVSRFCTLRTGDLIYTGTPAGVGNVSVGDKLEAWLGQEKALRLSVK